MKIHFVCSGNTFRSRMAEAYLNSKQTKLRASSSGITADKNKEGPISWYSQRILHYNRILIFTKSHWTKTVKRLLNAADLVVFMDKNHFRYCKENLGFKSKNFEIWNIPDLGDLGFTEKEVMKKTKRGIQASEIIYKNLVRKVNRLIRNFERTK